MIWGWYAIARYEGSDLSRERQSGDLQWQDRSMRDDVHPLSGQMASNAQCNIRKPKYRLFVWLLIIVDHARSMSSPSEFSDVTQGSDPVARIAHQCRKHLPCSYLHHSDTRMILEEGIEVRANESWHLATNYLVSDKVPAARALSGQTFFYVHSAVVIPRGGRCWFSE